MQTESLKLKQASAVLNVPPKDLQNLVQFGVLKPTRRAGFFLFDTRTLFAAKVALFLKNALGTSTELLSEFTAAFVSHFPLFQENKVNVIVFKSRPASGVIAVEVKVPFRQLAQQLKERLEHVELYKDMPRGRKRPGWKREFLASIREAAQDMGAVSTKEVLKVIRQYRDGRKLKPEVTVEAESEMARTFRRLLPSKLRAAEPDRV
jgi:hypothetical protein